MSAATVETYNGYPNRETWAVALYVNNDEGWQEGVHEALAEITVDPDNKWFSSSVAGDAIRNNVESLLTVTGYREMTGEDHLPANLSEIAEDIGSLYRVDWDHLGELFLSDLTESA